MVRINSSGEKDVHLELHEYQMSLTNPRDAPHRGRRAANKGGRSVR